MTLNDSSSSSKVKAIVLGPSKIARKYKELHINRYKFYVKGYDDNKKIQNHGIINTMEERF